MIFDDLLATILNHSIHIVSTTMLLSLILVLFLAVSYAFVESTLRTSSVICSNCLQIRGGQQTLMERNEYTNEATSFNDEEAAEEEEDEEEEQSSSPSTTASMQIMITNRMRFVLENDLNYLPEEVDAMEPQIAAVVISRNLVRTFQSSLYCLYYSIQYSIECDSCVGSAQ